MANVKYGVRLKGWGAWRKHLNKFARRQFWKKFRRTFQP